MRTILESNLEESIDRLEEERYRLKKAIFKALETINSCNNRLAEIGDKRNELWEQLSTLRNKGE